ncbi:hypothetical protein AVEN_184882-1 [Araneus ventricosus]|uniref:Uncharacterized protein n=1 Tax=Araneus ventricosus TaxID=182803 RepID=A0A4Y2GG90_ARAVE|nr:hypothetical protein AVEN_184882-1 [Araneus ventricosus]
MGNRCEVCLGLRIGASKRRSSWTEIAADRSVVEVHENRRTPEDLAREQYEWVECFLNLESSRLEIAPTKRNGRPNSPFTSDLMKDWTCP